MKYLLKAFLNAFPRPWLIKASYVLRPLINLAYKGNKFTDPINGKSYRCFLPYGYGNVRKNALSPGTLSLERHRLMWLYLKNHTNFFQDKLSVLHLAPEQCFIDLFKKQENIKYLTADLYSPIADVKADVLCLPFEDNSFDVVFCNHVLEHIQDDRKAMSELCRVLKPGGWGILQVPIRMKNELTYEDFSITEPQERTKHFGQYDHVRWYGKDYFERLRSVGFEAEEWNNTDYLTEAEIEKYGLPKGEVIPVVRKTIA